LPPDLIYSENCPDEGKTILARGDSKRMGIDEIKNAVLPA